MDALSVHHAASIFVSVRGTILIFSTSIVLSAAVTDPFTHVDLMFGNGASGHFVHCTRRRAGLKVVSVNASSEHLVPGSLLQFAQES